MKNSKIVLTVLVIALLAVLSGCSPTSSPQSSRQITGAEKTSAGINVQKT